MPTRKIMPYKRRVKERKGSNRYPVPYRAKQRRGYFPINNLAPSQRVVKLRFTLADGDIHTVTSSSGSISTFVYRANGMYDPYAGAGGTQPRGFDQYMLMYRHFTVMYSRIKLRFGLFGEATSSPMKVGVYLRDTTTSLTSEKDICEFPRIRAQLLTQATNPVKVSLGFNARKFFTVKDPLDEDDLKGTSGSDPNQQADYHVFGYCFASDSESAFFEGYIDYIAVLSTPILPTAS